MCTCIRSQLARQPTSIFSIILHWNQVAFQYHLALDNSGYPREAPIIYTKNRIATPTCQTTHPTHPKTDQPHSRTSAPQSSELPPPSPPPSPPPRNAPPNAPATCRPKSSRDSNPSHAATSPASTRSTPVPRPSRPT